MKALNLRLPALLFPVFISLSSRAQLSPSSQEIVDSFYHSIGEHALLYNGSEYTNFDPTVRGTPYFLSNELQDGTIYYYGVRYAHIPLLYDIQNDVVVTRRFNNGVLMQLASAWVNSYSFANHTFIRIAADSATNPDFPTGFYEVLYDGSTQVVRRIHKKVFEATNLDKSFVETQRFYIRTGDVYKPANSRRDLLGAFPNKKDIKRFMRSNHLNYKKHPLETLVGVAGYHDQPNK